MSLKIGQGQSPNIGEFHTGAGAAKQALVSLGVSQAQAALVYISGPLQRRGIMEGVRSVLGNIPCATFSTVGGLLSSQEKFDDVITVTVFHSDHHLEFYEVKQVGNYPEETIRKFGEKLLDVRKKTTPQLFFLFSEGIAEHREILGERAVQILGGKCPVVGGAGGGFDLKKEGDNLSQSNVCRISGLMLGGKLETGLVSAQAQVPFGHSHQVTESDGYWVRSIGEYSTVRFYREFFGELEREGLGKEDILKWFSVYLLAVKEPTADNFFLTRPVNISNDGSIMFDRMITAGSEVRLALNDPEIARRAVKDAARRSTRFLPVNPPTIIIFGPENCRYWREEQTRQMITETLESVPDGPLVGGCYTLGQYVWLAGHDDLSGQSVFRNGNWVICSIC